MACGTGTRAQAPEPYLTPEPRRGDPRRGLFRHYGLPRGTVALATVVVGLLVAVAIAGPALATTTDYYPPFTSGFTDWGDYPCTLCGSDNLYADSSNPTTGQNYVSVNTSGGFAESSGLWAEAGIDSPVFSFGETVSGSVFVNWTLTWSAQQSNFCFPPSGSTSVDTIYVETNIKDTTSGTYVYDGDVKTTIYSVSIGCPLLLWSGTGRNQAVDIKLAGVSFTAGNDYLIYSYVYASVAAAAVGVAEGAAEANIGVGGDLGTLDSFAISIPSSGGGGGGGGCVSAGTPILTPEGYMPIQDLKPGAQVEEYNFSSKRLVTGSLVSANKTTTQSLTFIDGGMLAPTPTDQPIYVHNSTFTGWLANPDNLQLGDQLFDPVTGQWVNVTSIETTSSDATVYDVVTTGFNNFVADGILLDIKAN